MWQGSRANLIRLASVVAFFLIWEVVGRRADPLFLVPPSAIFVAAVDLVRSGVLATAFLTTLKPFSIGMAISIVGGIAIGVLMANVAIVEYILDPFVGALYAIPRIALVPLIILWLGLEETGKIAILVSTAIFPVIINTFAGLRDVRGSLMEVGTAYGATRLQCFFKIALPAAVPFIMTGVRLAVGMGIIGITVAEFFTSINGLGGMIVEYSNVFATAKLFVPIIVIGLMGAFLTKLVGAVERRLSRWRIMERTR